MPKIKGIERIPDSNAMQFMLDSCLTQGSEYIYKSPDEARDNELASALFAIKHVTKVRIVDHSVIIFQDGETAWSPLLAKIAPFMREAKPLEKKPPIELVPQDVSIARKAIAHELRSVIDPELGINIVDLGLVYNIVEEHDKVTVEFTATTPGCPMRRYLQQHIGEALDKIDGITDHEAKLVWDPTWSVDMMDPGVELFTSPRPRQWIL